MSRSAVERKAAERERRKAAGLIRVEVWVRPENKAKLQELAKKLETGDGNMSIKEGFLKATRYEVTGSGREWVAHVICDNNLIEEISAVSEKQAHFLAQERYPEAKTPAETDKEFWADYNSAEGKSWRAKNKK